MMEQGEFSLIPSWERTGDAKGKGWNGQAHNGVSPRSKKSRLKGDTIF